MHFWDGVGRKLTFTTNHPDSKRVGDLVDFVNSVVGCVTDPPAQLGGETIIAAISDGKENAALFRLMSEDLRSWRNLRNSTSNQEEPR